MFSRVVYVVTAPAAVVLAVIAAVMQPALAVGGLALGVFLGMMADLWACSVATGDARQVAAAGRRVGCATGAATLAVWLVVTGLLLLVGPAGWILILTVALVVASAWLVRRQQGFGLPGPAEITAPLPVAPATLSTPELCAAWQRSYLALLDTSAGSGRAELVLIRASLLDELERRDREGFTRWLEAGARAGSDPGRYLTSEQ